MKYFLTSKYCMAGLVAAAVMPGQVAAAPQLKGELPVTRAMQVYSVKGEQTPALLNKASEDFSIMSVSGDKLVAIPYQFDDLNKRGFLYVPGGTNTVDGKEGIVEPQDELAFMLRDTGPQADAAIKAAVSGKIISELVFKEKGVERYAYIVEGNAERSDRSYTHYDIKTGFIKTTKFSLETDPDNLLVWEDMLYEDYKGGKKSLLDTMKLRVRAKLGFIKATLTNSLIPSEVSAVKNGPVRSAIALDASVSILGVGLADAGASITVTDQTLFFPFYLTIPKAASILSGLSLEVSLDFNELDGAKIRSELGPKEPVIAGSKKLGADPEDMKLDLEHSWLSGSTGEGWDIIAFFNGKEGFKPTLNTIYKDTRYDSDLDKPERFKGSHPHVGYDVSDIAFGDEIVIGIDLYFDKHFWEKDGLENAIEMIRNPMPLEVIAQ